MIHTDVTKLSLYELGDELLRLHYTSCSKEERQRRLELICEIKRRGMPDELKKNKSHANRSDSTEHECKDVRR